MIVGISGYARSGKDEAAKALVEMGFERRAFADKLREFLLALNPMVGLSTACQRRRVRCD
jgi:dephospho-CoA kinase